MTDLSQTGTSDPTPWWAMLDDARLADAHRAAQIADAALTGLDQTVTAEAIARVLGAYLSRMSDSAFASGLTPERRELILARLEDTIVLRARMLPGAPLDVGRVQ